MLKWDSLESAEKIAAEMPFEKRFEGKSVYSMLSRTVMKYSGLPAVSFQIEAGPKSGSETLNWGQLLGKVTQTGSAHTADMCVADPWRKVLHGSPLLGCGHTHPGG